VRGGVIDADALALAEAAHSLVESDTRRAVAVAERAAELARAGKDAEAEAAALHALGFARHELGDPRAIRTLRAAVRIADRAGLSRRAALARRPLAIYLAYAGAIDSAVREIDAACAALDGIELARCEVSRIAVFGLAGRAPALAASERALQTLRREGDAIWEARLLKNRGFQLAERGDATRAEPDLARARDLYTSLGATAAAVGAEYELARIELTRGDLPACLARLDSIDATSIPPRHRSSLELLRAKALLAARLTGEARQALDLAQVIWRAGAIEDPEGRLEMVTLTLLAGDAARAHSLARQAQRSFAGRRQGSYAARAAGLALTAAIRAGVLTPSAVRSGRRAARTLAVTGWREEALRVRLAVARAAIELGSPRVARRELAMCSALRRRGAVADRIEAWHIEALVLLAAGNRAGAQRAAARGLALLDAYRAALGAPELRATASEIGSELARLGLRIALAGSDAGSVLVWAEKLRANALRLAPVTPPDDAELRDAQTQLRRVGAAIRRAERSGGSDGSLLARQAALEASIRRSSRHVVGDVNGASIAPQRREIARALGRNALVELIELDGTLTALTLVDERVARHDLGPYAPVEEQIQWLRFALRRMTRRPQSSAQRAGALAVARASAEELSRRLIEPIADAVGERTLVVVPTRSLHAMPWAMLPALRGRPLVVAPSVATWLTLRPAPIPAATRIVLAAGPRLRHAAAELAAVNGLYPSAAVLAGRQATVTAVMQALDGATIAHVACHGSFRSDSPLFSSLELSDGPLNVYELQRLRRAPDLIVLSACDLAISDARPGDEMLGFAAALTGMGTRTVIASVVPAPDATVKRLMIALHRELIAGHSPAVALATAQATLRPGESALTGFVCLGSG
jgi:CHAT domain-containing protein